MTQPVIHHIPVCPFSQRVEILLRLKELEDAVEFRVVDSPCRGPTGCWR